MLHPLKCPSCLRNFLSNRMKTYCSRECSLYERDKRILERKKKTRLELYAKHKSKCVGCGTLYMKTNGNKRYCNDECKQKCAYARAVTVKESKVQVAKLRGRPKRATIEDMEVL